MYLFIYLLIYLFICLLSMKNVTVTSKESLDGNSKGVHILRWLLSKEEMQNEPATSSLQRNIRNPSMQDYELVYNLPFRLRHLL